MVFDDRESNSEGQKARVSSVVRLGKEDAMQLCATFLLVKKSFDDILDSLKTLSTIRSMY